MEDTAPVQKPKRRLNFLLPLWFILGAGIVLGVRIWQVSRMETPFVPRAATFQLSPPSQSLTARLTDMSENTKVALRDGNGYHPATPSSILVQGESLAVTGVGTATLSLDNGVRLTLTDTGEVSLISLLPDTILFWQKFGTVLYTIPDSVSPVSVRVKRALLELAPGQTEVSISGNEISVDVQDGTATIAIVDLENMTKVSTVSAGQTAVINDSERSVGIQ